MKTKPYKRFENLLLLLVVHAPALLAVVGFIILTSVIGYEPSVVVVGSTLALAVFVLVVLLAQETRSLRKEHEAGIARVARFSKNLKKEGEK